MNLKCLSLLEGSIWTVNKKLIWVNFRNNIKCIFIFVIVSTLFSSCLKINDIPKDENVYPDLKYGNSIGGFAYWPKKQNKKWVYKVSQLVGNKYVYIYDDTLEYFKDTNIAKSGYIYFSQFKFKRMPSNYQFFIGSYFPESMLSYYIDGVSYDAFNLTKINDSDAQIYSWNGSPFDNRYEVAYSSPFLNNFITDIGNFNVISSTIKYYKKNFDGSLTSFEKKMYLAKDIGLVKHTFNYKNINKANVTDSLYNLIFEIKEIIN